MGISSSSYKNNLAVSLIDDDPVILLRSGDLLLTAASDLEITLSVEPWYHVAIVVWHGKVVYVFHKGIFLPVQSYLKKHPGSFVRHLHCIRPTDFDQNVYKAATEVRDDVLRFVSSSELTQEGYSAAALLLKLNLVRDDIFELGIPKPRHFSAETSFDRLRMINYSEHVPL